MLSQTSCNLFKVIYKYYHHVIRQNTRNALQISADSIRFIFLSQREKKEKGLDCRRHIYVLYRCCIVAIRFIIYFLFFFFISFSCQCSRAHKRSLSRKIIAYIETGLFERRRHAFLILCPRPKRIRIPQLNIYYSF